MSCDMHVKKTTIVSTAEKSILKMKKLIEFLKEAETGIAISGSPTQKVSGEILKELKPVRHSKPKLSVTKTKSGDEVVAFANHCPVRLFWRLDSLTIVLLHESGVIKGRGSFVCSG